MKQPLFPRFAELVLQSLEDLVGLFERRVTAPFVSGVIVNLFIATLCQILAESGDRLASISGGIPFRLAFSVHPALNSCCDRVTEKAIK